MHIKRCLPKVSQIGLVLTAITVLILVGCGGGGGSSPSNTGAANTGAANTGAGLISTSMVTTLAGSVGVVGSLDGTGAAARFNNPYGITVDSAGNIYVADTNNHTIRKLTPAGVVSTLAGSAGGFGGSADGTGVAAQFLRPVGITVDSAGNLYVVDNYIPAIRKITPAGVVTTLAGSAATMGSADGTGAAAQFWAPSGITVDSAGNLYVVDNFTIRKINPSGVVSTLAGSAGVAGSADGTGVAARFDGNDGITVDSAGNLYVVDTNNQTIRKISPAGVVSTLVGSAGVAGSADGTGAAARFYWPRSIAVDSTGNLYVADYSTIRKITSGGLVTTLAGSAGVVGSADGTGAVARFNSYPQGITVDGSGNLYVADTKNSTIRKIQ